MCTTATFTTAQTSPDRLPQVKISKSPTFEVATIRPADPGLRDPVGLYVYPGGKIHAGEVTLNMLIRYALNIERYQISGGPAWVYQDRFDVVAEPPDTSQVRALRPAAMNAPPTEEQRQMLLRLLVDRFGLKFHQEVKTGPIYILLRNKSKLKLEPPRLTDAVPWEASLYTTDGLNFGEMAATNVTMPFLARRLSADLMRPVRDQTGISGAYDFHVEPGSEAATDAKEAIFESLRQIGLQLKEEQGPIESYVIDDVNKPAPN